MGASAPVGYRLELTETAASTGFFSAEPTEQPSLQAGLAYLRAHPFDSFMHRYLLGLLGRLPADEVLAILQAAEDDVTRALICEASLLHAPLAELARQFKRKEIKRLAEATPLIQLKSELQGDQALHRQWGELFAANMGRHRPLPPPKKTGLDWPVRDVDGSEVPVDKACHVEAIRQKREAAGTLKGRSRPDLEDTIARASQGLEALGIFHETEMRHEASLSPIALLRRWRFDYEVQSGSLHYRLSGTQTSYGRGLTLPATRAACLMEVAERCSSFAGVAKDAVTGTQKEHRLIHGRREDLQSKGYRLLDPNTLGLEVPYREEPLSWMEGVQKSPAGETSIWVPVQSVYLFTNLDERELFSGLGSTGLASGNTVEEARLSALYELIERDSEAVNPYHPSRCFRVTARDGVVRDLLNDYRARGIHLYFQDISPAYGLPCCTCFVTHQDGTIARGGAAKLNGQQAILSAMTETPYPYPSGPPSAPAPPDLPWLDFEALPNFSSGSPDADLALVEETLMANGFSPIYVDMTRKDLNIPVVRAFLPNMVIMADFDDTCRIHPRLFNNYLKIHRKA